MVIHSRDLHSFLQFTLCLSPSVVLRLVRRQKFKNFSHGRVNILDFLFYTFDSLVDFRIFNLDFLVLVVLAPLKAPLAPAHVVRALRWSSGQDNAWVTW